MKPAQAAQLSLFSDAEVPSTVEPKASKLPEPAPVSDHILELARRLPENLKLGTSSWSFPGWGGLVYAREYSERVLARDGLAAYCAHPLLRTVGLDRSFYACVPQKDLEHYAATAPDGFQMVVKTWEDITVPVFPNHPRYGAKAGLANPKFLDAAAFAQEFLDPFANAFKAHTGAVVLEFSPMSRHAYGSVEAFNNRLDVFLANVPKGFRYAVEVRNQELMTRDYAAILKSHGVGHVYNRWQRTPAIHEQVKRVGEPWGAFTVARIMLPHGRSYEERAAQCAPYSALVDQDEEMRADVLDLARDALLRRVPLFVILNNKAEGCAPLSCLALAEMMVEQLA